jgi:16S rRNA A1518/A1519 N6-dimethyltransferase RsmA/KsgA/DIM1 with predicted DNA glycosylase/AP lyase activity
MLRSSLSGGMHISKPDAESLLKKAGIDPNLRAQALSLKDWHKLYLTLP